MCDVQGQLLHGRRQSQSLPVLSSCDPDDMVASFKVFKKSSPNGKITIYLGKRDFVDHISSVDPIGKLF